MADKLVHEGKLKKKAISQKNIWKPRHFKLWRRANNPPLLEYYEKEKSPKPKGVIVLAQGTTVRYDASFMNGKHPNGMHIRTPFVADAEPPSPSTSRVKRSKSGCGVAMLTGVDGEKVKIKLDTDFVDLFAYAGDYTSICIWVRTIKRELEVAHGRYDSSAELQIFNKPQEVAGASALDRLGLAGFSKEDMMAMAKAKVKAMERRRHKQTTSLTGAPHIESLLKSMQSSVAEGKITAAEMEHIRKKNAKALKLLGDDAMANIPPPSAPLSITFADLTATGGAGKVFSPIAVKGRKKPASMDDSSDDDIQGAAAAALPPKPPPGRKKKPRMPPPTMSGNQLSPMKAKTKKPDPESSESSDSSEPEMAKPEAKTKKPDPESSESSDSSQPEMAKPEAKEEESESSDSQPEITVAETKTRRLAKPISANDLNVLFGKKSAKTKLKVSSAKKKLSPEDEDDVDQGTRLSETKNKKKKKRPSAVKSAAAASAARRARDSKPRVESADLEQPKASESESDDLDAELKAWEEQAKAAASKKAKIMKQQKLNYIKNEADPREKQNLLRKQKMQEMREAAERRRGELERQEQKKKEEQLARIANDANLRPVSEAGFEMWPDGQLFENVASAGVAYRSSPDLADRWQGMLGPEPGETIKVMGADKKWVAVMLEGHGVKFLPLVHPGTGKALFEPYALPLTSTRASMEPPVTPRPPSARPTKDETKTKKSKSKKGKKGKKGKKYRKSKKSKSSSSEPQKFCDECGVKVSGKFCSGCGKRTDAAPAAGSPPANPAPPPFSGDAPNDEPPPPCFSMALPPPVDEDEDEGAALPPPRFSMSFPPPEDTSPHADEDEGEDMLPPPSFPSEDETEDLMPPPTEEVSAPPPPVSDDEEDSHNSTSSSSSSSSGSSSGSSSDSD